jgi:hypothetical protein
MNAQPAKLLDLANAARQMDLLYRLEVAIAGQDDFISHSLRLSIANKLAASKIVATVKSMIEDNRASMVGILGEALVCRFISFTPIIAS